MTYNYYDYALNIFKAIISKEVTRGDESFSGYNKPKRKPKHPKRGKMSAAYWADREKW